MFHAFGRFRIALAILVLIGPSPSAAQDLTDVAKFDGVWKSQGYGWLWDISGGRVAQYQASRTFCTPYEPGKPYRIDARREAQLSLDRSSLRLKLEDPDYFYTFDRIDELPKACRDNPRKNASAVFDAVVELFDKHYSFFDKRSVDWPRRVAEARRQLRPSMKNADLFALLKKLLRPIGDSHVGIEAGIAGHQEDFSASDESLRQQPEGEPIVAGHWNPRAARAALGTSLRTRGDISFGRFAKKNVGYIEVATMYRMKIPELEDALDDALQSLQDVDALIVDVTRNGGGFDSYARLIAARFAEKDTVAYSKYAGDFPGATPQKIELKASARRRFTKPVFLISSQDTVSAAEVFALAMRALPNVIHVGETTDGSLSDELWKKLRNGWIVGLSNEVYLDSEGAAWEGLGVPPEKFMAVDDGAPTKDDRRAVEDFLAVIEAR